MKLRYGPVPGDPGFAPEDGGWIRLREPSFGRLMLWALPLSVALAVAVSMAWSVVARVRGVDGQISGVVTLATAFGYVGAFVLLLLVHEVLHALALPEAGLTSATTLGFWPKALTPYVSYEGELPRDRHILVGLTPFLVLSVAPIVFGLAFAVVPPWAVALGMLNAFGASGDLVGAGLVASQVPASAVVRNRGQETWWRPA